MIIRHYGAVELLVTIWMLTAFVACSQNETRQETNATSPTPTVLLDETNATIADKSNSNKTKSDRRAPLFHTAESSPWVRVYNRPPGTNGDTFFNYETRGNTSAHTSGEGWDFYRTHSKDAVLPVDRRDDKSRFHDILRVKPSPKDSIRRVDQKESSPSKENLSNDSPEITTNASLQSSSSSGKNDSQGYIVWANNDSGSAGGWTLDDVKTPKKILPPDNLIPKDGTKWKVVGDGGEDGWQVVGDKGDVEWKIEYDEGEWKVTSTGDVPVDAEWVDPNYVWADGTLNEDDEYNAWSAEDYNYSPWVDPGEYGRGVGNSSWPKNDYGNPVKTSGASSNAGSRTGILDKPQSESEETIKFGTRRKTPEKDSSKLQERTDQQNDLADDDTINNAVESPRADQNVAKLKTWNSVQPAAKNGQFIQGYGSKTWEVDNTGWNSGFGSESWVTSNKDFPTEPWVPKSTTGQQQDDSSNAKIETNPTKTENPIRGWGTGYGSKTWKGNEWDSNVVWKTGGGLPWTNDNNTWLFPDQDNADDSNQGGKAIVWSQPLPSDDTDIASNLKATKTPAKSGVKIKWPTRSGNIVKGWNTTPSRRTESESWGDDSSEGGVVWKVQKTDSAATDVPSDSLPSAPDSDSSKGWESSEWNINPQGNQKLITPPWKINAPPKTSNLISVKWQPDASIPNVSPPPEVWNQQQSHEVDPNNFPYWIFGGCKVAVKCGSTESDANDDSSNQSIPPDSSYDTSLPPTNAPLTTIAKAWPVKQFNGKSWGPPPENWKSPPIKSWKPPPTKSWRPPKKGWKPPTSPTPPPTMPETPPPTLIWTEPTPPQTILWPAPPPALGKQRRPKPNKSWKSPPTKSWRPPPRNWRPPPTKSWKPPSKNWQPSIATPAPDVWTTPTKPDCKDVTEVTWPSPGPDDTADDGGPPQILILTKLPGSSKQAPPSAVTDKGDTKDDSKPKPPGKTWVFPPRRGNPKGSKNRGDKTSGKGSKWPVKPKKVAMPANAYKGWPKGYPPPNFTWPGNGMRRWTTNRPVAVPSWIPPKYVKSKSWKQMLKKWMSGRF